MLFRSGTIIFVSHDRYFINKIATSVALLKNGKITKYVGNYDQYQETIKRQEEEKANKEASVQQALKPKKRRGNFI